MRGMSRARTSEREPLLAPIAKLSGDQTARAHRQMRLPGFGDLAQRRLRAARVLVVGAGGLGSASVPYLAGSGIGTIGIIDDDIVELSNLHRQIAHATADIGRPKADSLADTARAIDPGITVEPHRTRLTTANALDLFERYDLVIDGSDNFPTRYLTSDAAEITGIPLVWGALEQFQGQLGVTWPGRGPGYRDLFPAPPAPGDVLDCGTAGVLPGLCGTVGSMLATEALKIITGLGDALIGRVLLIDALTARTRELAYRGDPARIPVTALGDAEQYGIRGALSASALGDSDVDRAAEIVTPAEVSRALRSADPPLLLDVRTPEERAIWRIKGSIGLPLAELKRTATAFDAPVLVYCERGSRSLHATRILRDRDGVMARSLQGGISALAASATELVEQGE